MLITAALLRTADALSQVSQVSQAEADATSGAAVKPVLIPDPPT